MSMTLFETMLLTQLWKEIAPGEIGSQTHPTEGIPNRVGHSPENLVLSRRRNSCNFDEGLSGGGHLAIDG